MNILQQINNSILWRTKKKWESKFRNNSPSSGSARQKVVIIRLDEIGDYILFRNSLELYRDHYHDSEITLIGNATWSEIANEFDSALFDRFIPVDKGKYLNRTDIRYRHDTLSSIWKTGYAIAIQPTYSPDHCGADIFIHCGADQKISHSGDGANLSKEVFIAYTEATTSLINTEEQFEYLKNISFAEELTGTKYTGGLSLPVETGISEYVLIAPGAARIEKQWDIIHFAELINRLARVDDTVKFRICGSGDEIPLAESLIRNVTDPGRIENLCGKTSLPGLIEQIAGCKLVVSNDSSPVHIAAALGIPVVCPYRGDHYGRFLPYPMEVSDTVFTVFPANFDKKNVSSIGHSEYDINTVMVDEVHNVIKGNELLG